MVPAELDVMVKVQELPTPRDAVDGIARATRDPAVDFVEGSLSFESLVMVHWNRFQSQLLKT